MGFVASLVALVRVCYPIVAVISARSFRPWCLAPLFLGLTLASACKPAPVVVKLSDKSAPERAAQSFVFCVEARTSQCVAAADELAGWDSFYLLSWLGGGSPVAILEALPRELADHADPRRVQRRLVEEVERYASAIRGAECGAVSSRPIDPMVDRVAAVAQERLRRFGLWQGEMQDITEGLVEEAHEGLNGGSLVRLDCKSDPYRLYAAVRERDGHFDVIGLTTLLPTYIEVEPPSRDDVLERLHSRPLGLVTGTSPIAEGAVDSWLSFPVEEF